MDVRKNLFGTGPKAGNFGRGSAPTPPRGDGGPTLPQRVPVPRGLASPVRWVALSIAKIEDRTLGTQYIYGNL
jgi:hypothetical protein